MTCMPVLRLPPQKKGGFCILARILSWCKPLPSRQRHERDDESKPLLEIEVPSGDVNIQNNYVSLPTSVHDESIGSCTLQATFRNFFDIGLTNRVIPNSTSTMPDALDNMQPSGHHYVRSLWSSSNQLVKQYEVVPTLHLLSAVSPKWPSCGRIDFEEVSVEYG